MWNYGEIQWVWGLCGACSKAQMKGCVSCLCFFCPKEVKHFFHPSRLFVIWGNQSEGAGWAITFQRSCWGSIKVGYVGTHRTLIPMVWDGAKHGAVGASRASPSRGRVLCLQDVANSLFFLRNAWQCLGFLSLDSAPWFPCSLWQQRWRKDTAE